MPTITKRTPALAYLAALITVIVIWVAYRPLLHVWYELHDRTPSVVEAVELLRSESADEQRAGLAAAARMKPAANEVLHAVSALAYAAPDRGIRQRAAQYLSGVAQQQTVPVEMLQGLPRWTPQMDTSLAMTYGTLIDHAARQQLPPPNTLAFLDALLEHGDPQAKNVAILAFGQIGFHHGLDPVHVAQLTTMAAQENKLGNRIHSADAAWALKLIGQKQALPPATLEMLVELMRGDRDAHARQRAVWAVSTQLSLAPALADAVETALNDPDAQVRRAAQSVLYELEAAKAADLDQALQVATDEAEPSTRRLRAMQRLLQQAPADSRVLTIAQRMARHEDVVLRAGMASMAGALPDREAEALFEGALDDPEPQVRAAAVAPLIARRAAAGEAAQTALIQRLLGDPTPEVQRNVLRSIRGNELNSDALRAALRDLQTEDPQLAREGSTLLDVLERADRTPMQRFRDAALDPKRYGFYTFIAVAGLAVLVCLLFLLYFTARCFVYLSARQWRAATALGVVAAWVGVSVALGWAFFIGAFMAGGHNSPPPLAGQLSVVGVLLLLVGVYALLGFGLRRLVKF